MNAAFLEAADKVAATIIVKDALTSVNQPTTIEAKVITKGLFTSAALGGEPLELVIDGKTVAAAMTGGDGKAFLTYTPTVQGLAQAHVRVGNSPRVASTEGQGNLVVWEKRNPIIMIELSSLIEESLPSRVPAVGLTLESARKPVPEAADELGKLTQFYYRVIYVVFLPSGRDGFQATAEARDWLKTHKFPMGYVMALPPDANALGAKVDEFHAAGWRTIKTGIGRSQTFAEAFLQRRLDVIIVPEPANGEIPRKAKVAKDWREVRRKL